MKESQVSVMEFSTDNFSRLRCEMMMREQICGWGEDVFAFLETEISKLRVKNV